VSAGHVSATVPSALHGPLSAALGAGDRAYWVHRGAAGNAAQGLRLRFGHGGVSVARGAGDLGLALTGRRVSRRLGGDQGSTIVASDTSPGGENTAGRVDVFQEPATGWQTTTQTAQLTDGAADDLGRSVAISGTTIVAGAPGQTTGSPAPGAAYVYTEPTSGGWQTATQASELTVTPAGLAARWALRVPRSSPARGRSRSTDRPSMAPRSSSWRPRAAGRRPPLIPPN
jgi:hypothetical protein